MSSPQMMYYTRTVLLQCLIHLQAMMLPPCPCHWPVLPLLVPSERSIASELHTIRKHPARPEHLLHVGSSAIKISITLTLSLCFLWARFPCLVHCSTFASPAATDRSLNASWCFGRLFTAFLYVRQTVSTSDRSMLERSQNSATYQYLWVLTSCYRSCDHLISLHDSHWLWSVLNEHIHSGWTTRIQ